uniref:Uncharacterized protein n=1 Tax=Myoviridae sp. ct0wg9 TaxID=2826600 RepID=A0A8S5NF94_9CAUD|nr:MAG TPA: hypothetical protein [Myoviridae sp. ct0wg9]
MCRVPFLAVEDRKNKLIYKQRLRRIAVVLPVSKAKLPKNWRE